MERLEWIRRALAACWIGAVAAGLALGLASSAAAQEARTRAQLTAGLVKLGAEVQIEVSVEGAQEARIAAVPEIDGVEVLGVTPPRSSSFTTMVGGRRYVKSSISWSVVLRPTAEGDHELGDLLLVVDGEEVRVPVEPGKLKVVRDTEGDDLGYFELADAPRKVYEGQPFHLDLRFGWDGQLSVSRASLSLPWWGALPGTLEVRGEPRDATQTWIPIQVNRGQRIDVQRLAPLERDGQTFEQLQLRRRMMATRPGTLRFPQAAFEFGQLGARSPLGRSRPSEEYYALLPAFSIEVERVPEEGRPYEWTGAVGPLEVERELDRRDLLLGDVVELEVEWRGDANLEFFDLPDLSRLDRFDGFQVLGVDDRPDGLVRRTVFELRVVSPDLTEVPGVPLWTFDTTTESYRLVESDPVPVRVSMPEDGVLENPPEEPARGEDLLDIDPRPVRGSDPAAPPVRWLLGAAVLLPVLWVQGRRVVRRHGDPAAPRERRRRRALRTLEGALGEARDAATQRDALWAFLGARTRETEQAWIGRARADFHDADGAPLEGPLADELERLLADLDEAVHARGDTPLERGRVLDVARRLQKGGL